MEKTYNAVMVVNHKSQKAYQIELVLADDSKVTLYIAPDCPLPLRCKDAKAVYWGMRKHIDFYFYPSLVALNEGHKKISKHKYEMKQSGGVKLTTWVV